MTTFEAPSRALLKILVRKKSSASPVRVFPNMYCKFSILEFTSRESPFKLKPCRLLFVRDLKWSGLGNLLLNAALFLNRKLSLAEACFDARCWPHYKEVKYWYQSISVKIPRHKVKSSRLNLDGSGSFFYNFGKKSRIPDWNSVRVLNQADSGCGRADIEIFDKVADPRLHLVKAGVADRVGAVDDEHELHFYIATS